MRHFRETFRDRAAALNPNATKPRLKNRVPEYTGPKEFLMRDYIPQAEAKTLMPPPPSYLRRSRVVAAWNSLYGLWRVRSAKDDAWGGEAYALREVLRHAWYQCLLAFGLSVGHCPVKGLFFRQR